MGASPPKTSAIPCSCGGAEVARENPASVSIGSCGDSERPLSCDVLAPLCAGVTLTGRPASGGGIALLS